MSDLWARCLAEFEERANPEKPSDDPEVARWSTAYTEARLRECIAVLRDKYAELVCRIDYERTKYPFEINAHKRVVLDDLDRSDERMRV